jgi:hypothetical protein
MSEWISVEDRLPEKIVFVNVLEPPSLWLKETNKQVAMLVHDLDGYRLWMSRYVLRKSIKLVEVHNVTHWQPLPDPPVNPPADSPS